MQASCLSGIGRKPTADILFVLMSTSRGQEVETGTPSRDSPRDSGYNPSHTRSQHPTTNSKRRTPRDLYNLVGQPYASHRVKLMQ